jgi:chromosome segregation ATPase
MSNQDQGRAFDTRWLEERVQLMREQIGDLETSLITARLARRTLEAEVSELEAEDVEQKKRRSQLRMAIEDAVRIVGHVHRKNSAHGRTTKGCAYCQVIAGLRTIRNTDLMSDVAVKKEGEGGTK